MIFRLLITLSLVPFYASAQKGLPISKDYWKSKSFQKSFNGSYRINTLIEPYVDTKERALLISIQDLMAKGKREDALKKLQASKLAKTSASLLFNIGNIAYETGDLKLAEAQYSAALKLFPNYLRAHQNIAVIYCNQDDYKKAYPHLIEAVRLGSQDSTVMGMLGYCQADKDRHNAAIQAFNNAHLLDPENNEWKRGEAFSREQLGELNKALSIYKEVPQTKEIVLRIVNLQLRLAKEEDAIVNLELLRRKALLDDGDQLLLGKLHLRNGSRNLGSEAILKALQTDDFKAIDEALDIVRTLLISDDSVLANTSFALIKKDLVVTEAQQDEFLLLKAWLQLKETAEDNKADSLNIFTNLVKKNPLNADALYLLAQLKAKGNKTEEALLLYQQASKGNGDYKQQALLERGKLLVSQARYSESLKDLKAFEKLHPSPEIAAYIKAVEANAKASK